MINFDVFYKRNGIRLPQHLMLPYMPVIEKFEFPMNSLHHYLVYDSVLNGPESSEYFYRNIEKKIYVEHMYDMASIANKGNPRKVNAQLTAYARQFHMKNKRFRQSDDATTKVVDPYTLVTINYGLVGSAYRYNRSMYSDYYKWFNLQTTLWQKVASTATKTERNQFIFLELPETLPSMSQLDQFSTRFSETTVRKLKGPNAWFILEMWKWLSEEFRFNSVIGNLTQEILEKVNLVFNESGRFVVLNLGVINSWRYVKEDMTNVSLTSTAPKAKPVFKTNFAAPDAMQTPATESIRLTFSMEGFPIVVNPEATSLGKDTLSMEAIADLISHQKIKITPRDLQKRFLKLLMTLMSVRTVSEIQVEEDVEDPTNSVKEPTSPVMVDDDERTAVVVAQDMLAQLDSDLAVLDEMTKDAEVVDDSGEIKPVHQVNLRDFDLDVSPEEALRNLCEELADMGAVSVVEYKRFLRLAENYKHILGPNGQTTLDKFATIDPEELKIVGSHEFADIPTVVDKTMLKNSLIDFDEKYTKHIMQKDIAAMVVMLQKGGFAINKYEVERIDNIAGKADIHTIRITPIEGLPSTLRFTMPVVEEDGTYTAGGIRYRMRKQRGDMPLRKTDHDRVAMTTYFGKTFVTRNEKKSNNYAQWLRDQIMAKGMDASDASITDLFPADVFDNEYPAPRCYTSVAMGFKQFKSRGYEFIFDRHSDHFDPTIADQYNKNGMVVCAVNPSSGEHLVMDKNNTLYSVGPNGLEPRGSFESFIGLASAAAPVDFAQVKIYGKNLPVGMVLAYMYGLEPLMEKLKVVPRRVSAGQRLHLQDNEFAVPFSDETLIFSKDDQLASMVFGGFRDFERSIKQYSVHTFDKPNVYLNVFESQGIGVRYLREIQMFNDLFVDPISKDLLVAQKLPASFPGMLIKATELLLRDDHPDTLDMAHMRIKGYERLAGAVYAEVCQSIREHKTKSGRKHAQIELNPRNVWRRIREDPSVMVSSGINPIKNIKEREAVTYNGVGGRTSRSMVRATRAYHPNDMGIISESTVDNSDVGINTFLSADPQFNSVRGTSKPYVVGKTGMTALLSTAAQLSVGSTNDDPKRVNFVGVQHEHGIACTGYTQGMVRTGYEQVVAQRTNDMFCLAARKPGRVVSVKPDGIVIEYEDGEQRGVELGRKYGTDSGLTFAHEIKTKYKEGDTFAKGDVITYNEGFFEPDVLNPKNMVWKQGIMVNTVLLESSQTLEDASSISARLAGKLTTRTSKVKTVKLAFDQVIRNIVTVGTTVSHESILCIIEDAVTSNSNLFDEESLDTLRMLSGQTPTAKTSGVVERIEVFYHGDKEDMTDSLRAIANLSDRNLALRAKAAGKKAYTGEVAEELRLDGDALLFETMAIRFYITSDVIAGVGDKGVFANQMKTVFSEVMNYEVKTESGEIIDAIFGAKSIQDRIVLSPPMIGTTNKVLQLIGDKAVQMYFSK